jgi:hypothetical protein
MKIRLVFDDWRKWDLEKLRVESVYGTQRGLELSTGDLHSGSTFEAEIELDAEEVERVRGAFAENIHPVFSAYPAEAGKDQKQRADAQQLLNALLNKATPAEGEIFDAVMRDAEDLHGARMRVGELETMLRRFAGPDAPPADETVAEAQALLAASVTDQDRAALFASAVNVAVAAGTLFSMANEVQRMQRVAPHLVRRMEREAAQAQAQCLSALAAFNTAAQKAGLQASQGAPAEAGDGTIIVPR